MGRRGQSYSLSSVPSHPPATLVHRYAVIADPNIDGEPEIVKCECKSLHRECNIIVQYLYFWNKHARIII